MHEPIELNIDGEHYALTADGHLQPSAPNSPPIGSWRMKRLLTRALQQSRTRNIIRAWATAQGSDNGWDDHLHLARRAESFFASQAEKFHQSHGSPSFRATTVAEAVDDIIDLVAPEELRAQSWIEILVVDEDDTPCAHIDYEIELSDGRVRTGKTNEHGILRYEEIPNGACKVSVSAPDISGWELA